MPELLSSIPIADILERSLLAALLIERLLDRINPLLGRLDGTVTGLVIRAISDGKLTKDELVAIYNAAEDALPDGDDTEAEPNA